MKDILYFYGEGCPGCKNMDRIISKIEVENNILFEKYEVWNNEENDKLCMSYDKDNECGGVPFFFNKKTGESICGEVSYKKLLNFVLK